MKTIHFVFNSHIDPIWLWPWQSGLDEILATCRSACDRLDAHPDITYARGEAWGYDEVERIEPHTFERIQAHIKSGRWEVVGGWWLQPDCNQPSGFGMERQISLGKEYCESRFGALPRIGYNADSFGHAATLPGYMRAAGQDRYIMMRPMGHEMNLPANTFRWRGYEDGPEVVTFRICTSYNSRHGLYLERFQHAIDSLPPGQDHVMVFGGLGDHGGAPTEKQIQWIRDHTNAIGGWQIEFSTPSRFFDAIWPQRDSLPLVVGDLQQHAIGCYSAYRPIKTGVRKAEHLLRQAEILTVALPATPGVTEKLAEAWKRVAFNHFHDTLGGSNIASAYPQLLAQVGYAQCVADDILQEEFRKKLNSLPDDPEQRVVLFNASDKLFHGPVEFFPWLDWMEWGERWRLADEHGDTVPVQIIDAEEMVANMPQLLFYMNMQPGELRVLHVQQAGGKPSRKNARVERTNITDEEITFTNGNKIPTPTLKLYDDSSDTWSHGLIRYEEDALEDASWGEAKVVDYGPLMRSEISHGTIGRSELTAEWRLFTWEFVELRLQVDWREKRKLLKLVMPFRAVPKKRIDGIPGGWLERPLDGREMPMRDGVVIEMGEPPIGIVAPDVYGVDATPERIRFTLLRSPLMAHHIPHRTDIARPVYTDQGPHTFVFRFFRDPRVNTEFVEREATQLHRPPIIADLTRGMPCRLADPEADDE